MGLWSRDLIVSFFFFYPRSCIYLQQLLLLSTCSISHSLNISSYFILYLSYWCLSFFLLSTPSLFLSYFLPKMFSIWQGSDGFHTLMYHRWIVLLGGLRVPPGFHGFHAISFPTWKGKPCTGPRTIFLPFATAFPDRLTKFKFSKGKGDHWSWLWSSPCPQQGGCAHGSWCFLGRGNPWKHREFLYCFCPNTCVPCKFICSNPNPQWDGTRRGGLQEAMRPWRLSPYDRDSCPFKKRPLRASLSLLPHEDTMKRRSVRTTALTRHRICR